MKKQQTKDYDPIENLKEWQDHRYDPGYFTGGNIHPTLKARRPNKYGYFLLFGALIIIIVLFLGPADPDPVLLGLTELSS